MNSNIVNLPPNNKSGLYKAPLHTEGGVQVIVDGVKKIEVEGEEYHLEKRVLYNNKEYEFKNKTNLEILDYIFKDNKSVFIQGQANSSDYIICRLAVLDKTRHDFYGTAKDFVNLIQGEHGCKTTGDNDYTYQHRLGGEISNKNFDMVTIKYKGYIPYVADSFSHKFNQKSTLLRDYNDDTIVNENGRTDFKEPKYYSYGYLKTGTTLGTKRGWVLNLPKKGMSIEMEYHPQKFEEVNDLYWIFEGRIFAFPEDAVIEIKKLTEKNQSFRDEYNLGNSLLGYGKKSYVSFDDGDTAAVDMNYDNSIEKSNKYYAIYFGDENDGLYEKGLITHCLPNAYLYAKQYDVQQAHLLTIENGKVIDADDVYPYSDSTDLQEIATDWLNEYYGLGEYDEKELEKGIKVEEEHKETLEKLAKGEIGVEEGIKEVAKAHLDEDPAYYKKLEEIENPFGRFVEIVKSSKDSKEAFEKAKKIKDVPQFVADEFSAKYNPDGKLSMEKAFEVFYNEHKNDAVKLEKQELKDLIDLLKEQLQENPDDQESKDVLELYEETLKSIEAKFEKGGEIILKNNGDKYEILGTKSYADIEKNKDNWHIEYIESKSKGDGSLIINKIIEDAKLNGINKITLTAIDSSVDFFKKFAFKVKHEGTNDAFMELNLVNLYKSGGELNVEEAIINSPCVNKKFKFVESSDYNEYRKGGSINSMSEAELKEFYNTKEGKELDRQTYNKWKSLVNMSKSELEKFYNSEEGKEAGLSASEAKELGIDSGRESARWIMKMKDIPYTEWTSDMWRWAKKQIRFISRMSGVKGDLYDDKGNKTPKHTALLIWGHNPEKFENGGSVSFDKVISASTRFRPSETVVFDPPLEGKNGAKLISYTWSYEWTMLPNREGELKSKRISDWTQAEISADTGRDIVHQYTVLMPDGEYKTVSSDSVPVLLGYLDKKELKSFPNLVTASKTLAKQQMQLAIMEAQKKEYDELYAKFEKAEKPEIRIAKNEELPFAKYHKQEEGVVPSETYFIMDDVRYGQYNQDYYDRIEGTTKYKLIDKPNRATIEQLTSQWVSKRVEENGGKYPRGLYDLKNRVARQKRKVENILNTKMENGGEIDNSEMDNFDWMSVFREDTAEEKELREQEQKISAEKEKEDWYQKSGWSRQYAPTYNDAIAKTVKSYLDAKASYEDWGSRHYKSNKGIVYAGGDDIHGEAYTIGGINENRKRNRMMGAKMQMDESIELLKELGLNKDEISDLIAGDKFSKGGNVSVNKVSVYQTNFSGLSFSDLGGYFDSNFTDLIDLEDENVILKDAPIFLFFKEPYDTRYSSKISIDDVIGAIIPKKMEKDARTIFDKRYVSYLTYNDYSSNEDKIEAIKNLADINEDIILK